MQNTEYQVMARTMRPQRFDQVVGQDKVKQTLINAYSMKRLGHAYLFCGPHGTGKTTLARLFAKILNCDHPEGLEPCNQCSSCSDIASTRSMDVIEIDGASNRGIDDIRQINESVGFATGSGKYRIYIIDEVHMLTKEAFNALLKTLEDPPAFVKFFFATTEPHKVLSTILSRCQCFQLEPLTLESIAKHIVKCCRAQEIKMSESSALLIACRASGSLRDALVLTDQVISFCEKEITDEKVTTFLGVMPQSELFAFDQKAKDGEMSAAFDLTRQVFETGKNIAYFLDTLAEHYRQILYIKTFNGNPSPLPVPKDQWEDYQKSASCYSYEQCLHILDRIFDVQSKLKGALSKRVLIESLLLQIVRSHARVSVDDIVKHLERSSTTKPSPVKEEKPAPKVAEPSLVKKKVEVPAVETPKAEPISKKELPKPQMPSPEDAKKEKSRYDTVLQFAAVELEGSLKKEGR